MEKTMTRGMRNNNPLNIKISRSKWVGKIKEGKKDDVFEEFDTMENGLRAAIKLIQNYIKRMRLNTVQSIIYRWCPDETKEKYVDYVVKCMQVIDSDFNKNTTFYWYDYETLYVLIAAMAWQESRLRIDADLFYRAWQALDPHTRSQQDNM